MKKDWRYYLGLSLFIYSFAPVCVVALLPFWGLTLAEAGAFATVFLITGEVAFYGAAILLGKQFMAATQKDASPAGSSGPPIRPSR